MFLANLGLRTCKSELANIRIKNLSPQILICYMLGLQTSRHGTELQKPRVLKNALEWWFFGLLNACGPWFKPWLKMC